MSVVVFIVFVFLLGIVLHNSGKEHALGAVVIVGGMISIIAVLTLIFAHRRADADIAQREILQQMVSQEDSYDPSLMAVYGQAAEFNVLLARLKAFNDLPVFCDFVPDRVAALEFIKLPKRK